MDKLWHLARQKHTVTILTETEQDKLLNPVYIHPQANHFIRAAWNHVMLTKQWLRSFEI